MNRFSKAGRVLQTPEDAVPEWVTGVLHRSGIAAETRVKAVHVILRKELHVSTVCRLGLSYEAATVDPEWPRSLILKLPRIMNEDTSMVPGSDDRSEVEFYTHVALRIGCPPLIRCYDAAFSVETKRSHMVFEDLFESHSQPEQEHAPSEQMSRLAVEALAKAHAGWWNSPKLGKDIGTRMDPEALRKFVDDLNRSVTRFLAVAGLTPVQERVYKRMLAAADAIWGRMTRSEHLTVTHGDVHWWNFLFAKDPSSHSARIFDWQLWHIDLGARDLAFLLALGGFAEPRPLIEEELLRIYHESLIEGGVARYSWEMLNEDYRWSAIRNLNIPIIFWSQGKHESTWRKALRRAYESYERLGCGELLQGR